MKILLGTLARLVDEAKDFSKEAGIPHYLTTVEFKEDIYRTAIISRENWEEGESYKTTRY